MFVLCSLFSCLLGCPSTDGVPDNNENNTTKCMAAACTPGETKCEAGVITACAADENGCLVWVSGVDCGAQGSVCDDTSEPAMCKEQGASCEDGIKNQDETDRDCGGSRCTACAEGASCVSNEDCSTNLCNMMDATCAPNDVETCKDNIKNEDETDTDCGGSMCPKCELDAACMAASDCASNTCTMQKCVEPKPPGCMEGQTRCGMTGGVETCDDKETWIATQSCPQGCDQGACVQAVQCNAHEARCLGDHIVQLCNPQGSAWTFESFCDGGCLNGACQGDCAPDTTQCNGADVETCSQDGKSWSKTDTCAMGCSQGVCVEQELVNQGIPMTMSGNHVYKDCVKLELGGTITVPENETLQIWARCVDITNSGTITLENNAKLFIHATTTFEMAGTIQGGASITLSSYASLNNTGTVNSEDVTLRADELTNGMGGVIQGTNTRALYGFSWKDEGTHSGLVSVMPPLWISSSTHPAGYTWNLYRDAVNVSWDRPFEDVQGYYVTVNGSTPSPSEGEFVTTETISIPLDQFLHGDNVIRVVSTNSKSEVGTYEVAFTINFNAAPPVLTSTSHPDSSVWSDKDDPYFTWDAPTALPEGAWIGYYYAWDHFAHTVPDFYNGTLTTEKNHLIKDQAPGVWAFHVSGVDRLGRVTPYPAHYIVRIGPDPGSGNVAGSVKDKVTKMPIRAALVHLNGGIFKTSTLPSGDYTFGGVVTASSDPYFVSVTAPGYDTGKAMVTVESGKTEVLDIELTPNPNREVEYVLGHTISVTTGSDVGNGDVAMGKNDTFAWSTNPIRTRFDDEFGITSFAGQSLHKQDLTEEYADYEARSDVGWNGERFWLLDFYKCDDNGSYRYGHGWSCLWMETFDLAGQKLDGPTKWRNSGQTGSPSAAWNGTSFGTFFFSYTRLLFRDLTKELTFSDGKDPHVNSVVADDNYDDARRYVRTRTVWDGTHYATVFSVRGPSTYDIYFVKTDAAGATVVGPKTLTANLGTLTEVGLVFDGQKYHVTYSREDNQKYELLLRSISQDGATIDNETSIVANLPRQAGNVPSMTYDGRYLLLTYEEGDNGFLEVRDPFDHSLVKKVSLGKAHAPKIDFNRDTQQGVILYGDRAQKNTYARPIWPR